MIFFGVTWMPLEALLDTWILSTDDLPHSDYGSIRSGGSLGFSIITLFFGSLIVRFGFKVSPMAFILSGSLLFFLALTTNTHTRKAPTRMGLRQVRLLLSNKKYIALLGLSILIFIGHMGINNFYIYVVNRVGSNESLIGQAAALAAFVEIFGFYLAGKLQKKIDPMLLMIAIAIGSFCRIFFLAHSYSLLGILLTAAIQGLTFSLFLGTFKIYISEITPISLLASAQTLGASTYFGISSILANIIGGILIDDYGIESFYNSLIIIALVAIVYSLALYAANRFYKARESNH
jgi:PPP family 3-phenylpropionic acid transporter